MTAVLQLEPPPPRTTLPLDNIFDELLRASEVLSLGQITGALYEVGGAYRRNM